MEQYLPILTLGVLGVVFVLGSIVASRLLAPNRATTIKSAPYECGITDTVDAPERFPVKFYLVAMLFIMFDIEIVFLYPWAVANAELGLFGLIDMLIFCGLFFAAFVYALAVGALNWGPGKQRLDPARSPERTTTSTIRKVGLEGRLPVMDRPAEGEAA
ncbi:MAG: NAD(P)H-quinone oxidoreductase subunit 3 [Actinomycetia bacterium]|nr:NAD(P)H-quinone oxidoreductase subunit 3 [Actinomycetes bacterium]MCP4962172.1 NAD(P)H-quinone oxidoreductase subunit 3 [Actinomycetes bacterium]